MNPSAPTVPAENLAQLLERLGSIPLERILLQPPPGTASEHDVLTRPGGVKRLCELVDGVLVEKPIGYYEARLAVVLIGLLERFLGDHDVGIVVGADATTRLQPGLVRLPDVSFVSRARLPDGKVPRDPVPDLPPDLAVEIISASNTPREMDRKLREYFEAGVRLVWYVYPDTRTVRVYQSPDAVISFNESQTLGGGELLPGFSLRIQDWFDRAD